MTIAKVLKKDRKIKLGILTILALLMTTFIGTQGVVCAADTNDNSRWQVVSERLQKMYPAHSHARETILRSLQNTGSSFLVLSAPNNRGTLKDLGHLFSWAKRTDFIYLDALKLSFERQDLILEKMQKALEQRADAVVMIQSAHKLSREIQQALVDLSKGMQKIYVRNENGESTQRYDFPAQLKASIILVTDAGQGYLRVQEELVDLGNLRTSMVLEGLSAELINDSRLAMISPAIDMSESSYVEVAIAKEIERQKKILGVKDIQVTDHKKLVDVLLYQHNSNTGLDEQATEKEVQRLFAKALTSNKPQQRSMASLSKSKKVMSIKVLD